MAYISIQLVYQPSNMNCITGSTSSYCTPRFHGLLFPELCNLTHEPNLCIICHKSLSVVCRSIGCFERVPVKGSLYLPLSIFLCNKIISTIGRFLGNWHPLPIPRFLACSDPNSLDNNNSLGLHSFLATSKSQPELVLNTFITCSGISHSVLVVYLRSRDGVFSIVWSLHVYHLFTISLLHPGFTLSSDKSCWHSLHHVA